MVQKFFHQPKELIDRSQSLIPSRHCQQMASGSAQPDQAIASANHDA
jgi:hypothetical protein